MSSSSKRCVIFAMVIATAVTLAIPRSVRARPAPSASEPTAQAIDSSTVRVFSIGTVSTEIVDVRGQRIQIANALSGHGTGFVIGDRLVMTAHHVIENARHVVVRLPGDGGFFAARVVFAEKNNDVALLELETDGTALAAAPLELSKTPLRVRSNVFAIGYPIDASRTQPQSARGIIAGFLDDATIQLDIALNPGNSGGPIVDEHDAVVGMAIARGNVEQGVQGIGYAVPVSKLLAVLTEGKRRLDTTERVQPTSRDSAFVVDELVQNGALHELRKASDLAKVQDQGIDRALRSLLDRIKDPDLLVFVAGAMWNVSLALELGTPDEVKLSREQAGALAWRLRESSAGACKRAVELDAAVADRSSFVNLALAFAPVTTAPAPVAARIERQAFRSRRTMQVLIRGAPVMRMNPETGTIGFGFGAAVGAVPVATRRVYPITAVTLAGIQTSNNDGEYLHVLLTGELGLGIHAGPLELDGTLAPGWYRSSVHSTTSSTGALGSASGFVMTARFGAAIRVGAARLGTATRVLSGGSMWFEPAYLAFQF
ncbi:MAG: S1C family serine protease [Kofleriaceae bacterium]